MLGTTAGAVVIPTSAASLDMAVEFVIEAFAVVVIGGLGSMRGALFGALIVGLIRAVAILYFPEIEVLAAARPQQVDMVVGEKSAHETHTDGRLRLHVAGRSITRVMWAA